MDDWAWRKGVTYGSIVIDLKEGCPIDLLGDRETDSFREWMQGHEQVDLVSRDRSTDYSSAIAVLDRNVTEIADKFHLVKNIYDRFGKLIAEHYDDYRRAVRKEEEVKEVVHENTAGKTSRPQKTDSRDIMFKEVNITNGITEGYVNKLKAVKRLMYGRAGIELLKNKLVLEHVLFN